MKTAIVTGGAQGIGAAIVKKLTSDGYHVVYNYIHSKAEAEAAASALPNAVCLQADLSKADSADALVACAHHTFGEIDLLVNNAGIAQFGVLSDLSSDELDRLIAVNLKAPIWLSRAVLPDLLKKQSGSIVNISSMWGEVGASCEVAYSATKAGVIGFTKALAKEVGPSGIRVNCITPGVIDTRMNAHLSKEQQALLADETPLCRIGTPAEIANAVSFLASDAASFITGQILGVNGGFVI